jgi:hypothetical protein
MEFFTFAKHLNLNFWWQFKVCQANCLWADFGKFGQFWADSAALTASDSMPQLGLKS